MKKKKVLTLLTTFAVTALPVVTLLGTDVSAAPADRQTDYSTNGLGATSEGWINFTPNTDPVDPIDPDGGDDPYVPDDTPVNPDDTNPLKIVYVSTLDFDTQSISSEEQVYTANKVTTTSQVDGTTKEMNPAVTISDGRGTGAGWTLQVQQDSEFTDAASGDTLEGADLVLNQTDVYTNTANNAVAPTGSTAIDVNTTGNTNVLTAAVDAGQGTWQEEFEAQLTVAGNTAQEGNYSTSLTWTLLDAPA
ncbi:WxL domain-containing protein [Listeria monocytogenes]|uniref:WxL domain-containing protein n=1 Tax=Listeria seeligeri TaxID=1640 RepID=UPI0022EAA30A|nr:WxL domain-containing protein [Listeria seeligeri]EKT6042412.1 WxL domain-containing protein [Listeria monocytogenes]EKT6045421.1 WxL domain-containing protein [Listeria monocytogenes]